MEISNNRQTALLILLALCLAVLSTLVGDSAKTIADAVFGSDKWIASAAVVFLVSAILFSAVAFALFRRLDKIVGAKVETRTSLDDRKIKYLLMGYSPLKVKDISATTDALINELDQLGPETVASSVADYNNEREARSVKAVELHSAMPGANLWQQNLRAAWAHRNTLRRILILNPDINQFENLKRYLSHALKDIGHEISIDLITHPSNTQSAFETRNDQTGDPVPPSYENYLYVYQGLLHGLQMISGDSGNTDSQTCIDATPGYKPFSIAAAMLTLKRKIVFSYITTGPTGGNPKYYDVDLTVGRTAG